MGQLRTVRRAGLAAILALSALAGCSHRGCDRKQLDHLEKALPDVPPDLRGRLGLEGLHEACGAHLPGGVDRAFAAVGSGKLDPSQTAVVVAHTLSDERSFSEGACPDFKRIFSGAAALDAAKRARFVYDGCHYGALGLLSAQEYDATFKRDVAAALFSPGLYVWLEGHGVKQAEARELIRGICALP